MTFNPDEDRDERGRWSTSGSAKNAVSSSANQEFGEELTAIATDTAKTLNYDPKTITVTDERYPFALNGKEYTAAGTHDPTTGEIKLYTNNLNDKTAPGVLAHEIMHGKFKAFMDQYDAETKAIMAEKGPAPDPNGEKAWQKRGGSWAVMSADGSLRAPYDKKYPVYQQYTKLLDSDGIDNLAKSDGITDYSTQYWDAWNKNDPNVPTRTAINETLAEMARLHFEQGEIKAPPGVRNGKDMDGKKAKFLTTKYPSKEWTALYKAVTKHWDKSHK